MNDVLEEMIKVYQPEGVDWMGYKMTPDNPYTYHHIKEKRVGGKLEVQNGAILTRKAHEYLNHLEKCCPEAYQEFQHLFREINASEGPISDELYEKIYYLLYRIQKSDDYRESSRATRREETKKQRREAKVLVKRYLNHYSQR